MDVNRLHYSDLSILDAEEDVADTIKVSLDREPDEHSVLAFRFPADAERFTDLSSAMLEVETKIVRKDGKAWEDNKDFCFLEPGGVQSLWSSCEVHFNGSCVSNMSLYPYTTALVRYLGLAKSSREAIFDVFGGSWAPGTKKADITNPKPSITDFLLQNKLFAGGKITLSGPIYSDILQTSRQLLPSGFSIDIILRRASEDFSMASPIRNTTNYRLEIVNASVSLKRLRLRPGLKSSLGRALSLNRACMVYNRLSNRVSVVPKGIVTWRWNDVLASGPIPNRIYLGFVAQKSFYGDINHLATFFDNHGASSYNIRLNGRELLSDPIQAKIEKAHGKTLASSDAKQVYKSLLEIMGFMGGQKLQQEPLRLTYHDVISNGIFIVAFELGKSGRKPGSSGAVLDIEVFIESI